MADENITATAPDPNAETDTEGEPSLMALVGQEFGLEVEEEPEETPAAEPEEEEAEPEQETEQEEEEESEAEEESEEESAEETEEDEEEESENEMPEWMKARLSKMADQKNEAREERDTALREIDQLKDQLDQARSQAVTLAPSPDDPFSDVFDAAKLEEARKQQEAVIRWCDDNDEGGEYGEAFYDAKQVRQIRRQAEAKVKEALPARQQWLADSAASLDAAKKDNPEILTENSSANNLWKEAVEKDRNVLRISFFPELIALADAGLKVRNGSHVLVPKTEAKPPKKKVAKKVAKKPPTSPKATGSPGPSNESRRDKRAGADDIAAAMASGDDQAIQDAIASNLNL